MTSNAQPIPKNVFIDASTFRGINFHYSNPALKTLVELTKKESVHLYFTDISYQETKSLLLKTIDEGVSTLNRIHKKNRTKLSILQNIDDDQFQKLFSKITREPIETDLLRQFENFVANAKIEIISTDNVSVLSVFDKYFTRKPPFGDGKKKDEFPDAFTFEALKDLSISKKFPIAIILEGLRGEESISAICRREGIAPLLPLEQGFPGSRQEASHGRYSQGGQQQ